MRTLWASALVLMGCGVSTAEIDGAEDEVLSGTEYSALSLPEHGVERGDVVRLDELSLVVPRAGESVEMQVHFAQGSRRLVLSHAADGKVTLAALNGDVALTAGGAAACTDATFTVSGSRWATSLDWSFRSGQTPNGQEVAAVEAALKRSAENIVLARNDCGLTATLTAKQKYLGRTTRGTNIVSTTSSVSCGTRDAKNVVTFGELPRGTVGLTCTWSAGGVAVESDIKLNRSSATWFAGTRAPFGCSSALSIESVATHEFGHAFGLNHVTEADHGGLTMSTHVTACTTDASSLGRGDVLALDSIY